jgi:hypothetical protein
METASISDTLLTVNQIAPRQFSEGIYDNTLRDHTTVLKVKGTTCIQQEEDFSPADWT